MNTLSYLYLLWEVVGDGTPTMVIEYMRVDSSLLPVFVIVSVRRFFVGGRAVQQGKKGSIYQ